MFYNKEQRTRNNEQRTMNNWFTTNSLLQEAMNDEQMFSNNVIQRFLIKDINHTSYYKKNYNSIFHKSYVLVGIFLLTSFSHMFQEMMLDDTDACSCRIGLGL